MFNIVDQLNVEHTKNRVTELMLQGCPSKEEEDGTTNGGVKDKVRYHLVVEEDKWPRNVITEFLLYSFNFSFPSINMGSDSRPWDESID